METFNIDDDGRSITKSRLEKERERARRKGIRLGKGGSFNDEGKCLWDNNYRVKSHFCLLGHPGAVGCTDALRLYTGMAANGDVHRLVHHDHGKFRSRHGAHITGLEGCWGYLKRRLAAKGGIRRERLPLYLAAYVWRDKHRWRSLDQQLRLLMTWLHKKHGTTGG